LFSTNPEQESWLFVVQIYRSALLLCKIILICENYLIFLARIVLFAATNNTSVMIIIKKQEVSS
jgi:hypothetical protein